jgi:hypothetical protein
MGYPNHMIQTIKNIYEGTAISMDKGINTSSKTEMINHGLQQGCSLSPTLFSICIDATTNEWQMQLGSHFSLGSVILDTSLFADDLVIFGESEDELQMATLQLSNIMATYNLEISHDKTNIMAFHGKHQIRSKIILHSNTIEQIQRSNYLGCDISYNCDRDLSKKNTQISMLL